MATDKTHFVEHQHHLPVIMYKSPEVGGDICRDPTGPAAVGVPHTCIRPVIPDG